MSAGGRSKRPPFRLSLKRLMRRPIRGGARPVSSGITPEGGFPHNPVLPVSLSNPSTRNYSGGHGRRGAETDAANSGLRPCHWQNRSRIAGLVCKPQFGSNYPPHRTPALASALPSQLRHDLLRVLVLSANDVISSKKVRRSPPSTIPIW